jgi:N-acetylmuramoyl-L-alanine amidase
MPVGIFSRSITKTGDAAMKTWKIVLVGAVLTAMVFIPAAPDVQKAPLPVNQPIAMAELKMEKIQPVQQVDGLSRSPVTAYVTAQKPLNGIRICVDPGHGGQAKWDKLYYCGGTIGASTGQTESDVNLRVALCLRQYLEAAGAEVIMTRIDDERCTKDGDKSEELDFRSNLANSRDTDLFISVHHNEGSDHDANYTAAFYPPGTSNSISLAENIASAVSRYLGTPSIGGKPGNYRVLNKIHMPGVIVEASFMSNPSEDKRLSSLSYDKMEAKAICTGILNYMRMAKGRQVDFNTIFKPIDDQAYTAQTLADASFVRKQIVEKRSLFGVRYEEITYDANGNVTAVRPIGGNTLASKASKVGSAAKSVAKIASKSAKKITASAKKAETKRVKKITVD